MISSITRKSYLARTMNLLPNCLVQFVLLLAIVAIHVLGHNEVDDEIIDQENRYSNGIIGFCNRTKLNRPPVLGLKSETFRNCFIQINKSAGEEDTLPVIQWKIYLCILNSTNAFKDGEVNFDDYVNFMTLNYPEFNKTAVSANPNIPHISDEIKTNGKNCSKTDDNSEQWEKVMKFTECFFKTEETLCVGQHISTKNKRKCEGLAGGVERVVKFPFGCCKDKPITYTIGDLYSTVLLNFTNKYSALKSTSKEKKRFEECKKSFTNRQYTLMEEPHVAVGSYRVDCEFACALVPMKYVDVKSLELNNITNAMDHFAVEKLPKPLQKQILDIIPKYTKIVKAEMRNMTGVPSVVTNEQYVQDFLKTNDELEKIHAYCSYPHFHNHAVYFAFYEYCTDEKTLKAFAKDWIVE